MAREFRLPDLGEGVHEGQIVRLLVEEGASVAEDAPLMEVETDKAAVEIPSPFAGRVTKWHVAENDLVHVGEVMVTFDGEAGDRDGAAESSPDAGTEPRPEAVPATAVPDPVPPAAGRSGNGRAGAEEEHGGRRRKRASPATRKRARVLGLELESIEGTGPGGRVTRADVERAAEESPQPAPTAAPSPSAPAGLAAAAAPAGVPTPPAAAPRPTFDAGAGADEPEPPGEDGTDTWGPIRTESVSRARRTIAANMVQSWTTIPQVIDQDDADVTDLDRLRRDFAASDPHGRRVTMLAFVVEAVARALRRHPIFNAWYDADQEAIIHRRYVNIAVGVHTERGLVTPVIRDADRLTTLQIAGELARLADLARSARFAVNDTRGGTFTISNAGALGGSRYTTPIVPPGQTSVLALGRTRKMPRVVTDAAGADRIEPRLVMPLSHAFDHRIADGGDEVAFLQDVIGMLEHPTRLLIR